MNIAVLGCGPAGLLVAHACAMADKDFVIFSRKQRSRIGGAQFLHTPIPELTGEAADTFLNFLFWGDIEGYAQKVYGDPQADVSWGSYEPGFHAAWNMQAAYDKLWAMYAREIVDTDLNPLMMEAISADHAQVFSTVPLPSLCFDPTHRFFSQDVWIVDGGGAPHDSVIYNGLANISWYRECRIFGTGFQEWPYEPRALQSVKISKPLRTNCDCWHHAYKFGRYGKFQKKVLINHAFEEARDALLKL
jgi:hypothetical protein